MKATNKINKKVENRLSLYLLIINICNNNMAALTFFTGIYDIYLGFKTHVDAFETLIDQKLLITSGLSKDKSNTKRLLAALANRLAAAVHIYATQSDNIILMEMMDFCISDLKYVRDEDLVKLCEKILAQANLYAPVLIVFGIDANTILTFQTSINLYEGKNPLPKAAIEHRKTLTRLINEKITEITFYKKHQLDRAIILLETSHVAFVSDYRNASRIIKDGTRHKKIIPPVTSDKLASISGTVKDSKGNPLKGVTCVLIAGDKSYTDVTDKKGLYVFGAVPDGTYTLQVILFGKKMIMVKDMVVKTDEIVEKDFKMEDDAGAELAKILK
jgi:hypothetical protein